MKSIVTVTTAATSRLLTTRTRFKSEVGITATTDDDMIDAWLLEASDAIAAYCGRQLLPETVSETFRLAPGELAYRPNVMPLTLARWPVTTLTSVVEEGVTLASTDYEVDKNTGCLWRLSDGYRARWYSVNIVVAYIAGYADSTAPRSSLATACLSVLKHRWAARSRDPMVKSQDIPGVLRTDYWVGSVGDGPFPAEVMALLDPYRDITL
jgi:hypothetical protein